MAAFIFVAPGVIELPFALLALAASIAIVWRSAAGAPESGTRAPGIDRKDVPHLIKAVSYLVVFAFIFGAVSQMSVIDRQSTPLTEVQALLGISLAALLSCLVARRREGAGPGCGCLWGARARRGRVPRRAAVHRIVARGRDRHGARVRGLLSHGHQCAGGHLPHRASGRLGAHDWRCHPWRRGAVGACGRCPWAPLPCQVARRSRGWRSCRWSPCSSWC